MIRAAIMDKVADPVPHEYRMSSYRLGDGTYLRCYRVFKSRLHDKIKSGKGLKTVRKFCDNV